MFGQLPDAPVSQSPAPSHGFWYIRVDPEPPLKIHKREFILEELAMYGATAVDMRINRKDPNTPTGKDFYVDNLVPAAAASGFHFLLARCIGRSIALVPVSIVTGLHIHASITGRYQ
jgi:hypothetical protein